MARDLLEIADRIRALATTGLHFTESDFDRERYQELMGLDDRTLADIGILRRDIPKVVRNAYAPRTAPAETPAAGATVHRLPAGGKSGAAQSDDTDRPLAA